jgi:hypothetical protein
MGAAPIPKAHIQREGVPLLDHPAHETIFLQELPRVVLNLTRCTALSASRIGMP